MTDHPLLFLPGPTEVDPDLLAAMSRPMIGHRQPEFVSLAREVVRGLGGLFRTAQKTGFETCPATALMEAAVRNLPRGARTLHLVCGAFSSRWAEISIRCGRDAEVFEVPMGCSHDAAALRDRLLTTPPYEAVAITHNETSTGAIEPLADLAATVRAISGETLILVDAVSSFGGAPLHFDSFGLDLAFAGTQECLAPPPGLTVFAASDRFLRRAESAGERGFLFDLPRSIASLQDGKTLATPCVPLVFALERQLQRIEAEGLENRWRRHQSMRDQTLDWAARHGFEPFVPSAAARSWTVTCLRASGRDVGDLARRALGAGFAMDRGYGPLKGSTFRIGHLGDHDPSRLSALLRAIAG
ncbi:MAG: alanine--glyoxylate aminotransferase family protein [Planctomycetota bacterium]